MAILKSRSMQFVLLMGVVSLLADMTYEGGRSLAGPYLALLGASGTVVGVVAGFGEFVGYMLRLVFGYISDKTRQYWVIAFSGYVINLFAIPSLALTGRWQWAAALLVMERVGKGIRNPARDTMLSHATHTLGRGWGFGIHEAMDQTGAMLGPLVMAAMLYLNKEYHACFAALAIPALLALAALTACWAMFRHPEDLEAHSPHLESKGLPRAFWIYLIAIGLVAAGYADFPLIAYHFGKAGHLSPAWVPTLYALAMGIEAVGALGFGRLFDRWGVWTLVAATAVSAFFAPLVFRGGFGWAGGGMLLWGIGMGAQGSVMKAVVAELVSKERRGSAYGIYNAGYGLCWFAGSALMGWLYDRSIAGLIAFSMIAQIAALPIFLTLRGAAKPTRTF
jgi:MFS family permease